MNKRLPDLRKANRAEAWLTPLAAFLLTGGLWTAALALFGLYPFGDKSILITDMGQQYIEFFAWLYDTVTGGGSLLFTWNSGLGMNMVGLFAYYLSSPFTWLMFLFERTVITDAVLLIISLKIASAGLTFSLFLRRSLGMRGLLNLLFSACYALSAYTVVNCFNIMWLDAVILLPLVIMAVRHVEASERIAPLTAVYTVLFLANFYTGYMVGIFSLLALIALVWIHRTNRRSAFKAVGLLVGAALLAAGLSAFLLLPTFLSLLNAGSSPSSPLFWGFLEDPLTLLGKGLLGAYDSITDSGSPYLYCGILAFVLLPLWAANRLISRREKVGGGLLLGFLLVSMMFNPLDYAWHAFDNAVWFPCRYSFLFIFVVLTLAARGLSLREGLSALRVVRSAAIAVGVLLIVKLPEWLFPDNCDTVSGRFWLTMIGVGVYGVVLLAAVSPRRWLRRVAHSLLLVLVCVELTANTVYSLRSLDKELSFENHSVYLSYMEESKRINTLLTQAGDTGLYRVENIRPRNPNSGLSGGYPTVSHYSSFSQTRTFSFLKSTGWYCMSQNKILRYYGSTPLMDTLLGVKYLFTGHEVRAGYRFTGIEDGGLMLWENPYALPLAYFGDSTVLSLDTVNTTPFTLQNALLRSLDGQAADCYTPLDVTSSIQGGELVTTKGVSRIAIDESSETAQVTFTIHNPADQYVLLYLNNNLSEWSTVYVNGGILNTQSERSIRGVMELGYQEAGDIAVSLMVRGRNRWFSGLCAAGFREDVFYDAAERLHGGAATSLEFNQSRWGEPIVSGSVTAPRDGVLFTSIPSDLGWTAFIDGHKVKTATAADAFLAVPLSKGAHTFTLRYRPRGLTAGVGISAVTVFLSAALWGMTRRKNRRKKQSG